MVLDTTSKTDKTTAESLFSTGEIEGISEQHR
jgi:hypothetical protein